MNVEADTLSHIPWENTQVEHMEPLIVKTMLQSKLESETSFPNEYLPVNILLKNTMVDTTPKLTQMDDMDVGKVSQLLKSNKLSTYMAQEIQDACIHIHTCERCLRFKHLKKEQKCNQFWFLIQWN